MRLLTGIGTLEDVLGAHAADLGADATAYRNHVYRVVNLCVAQADAEGDRLERFAIAAAFHDLGIWTGHTFDYLQPSVLLATAYLAQAGRSAWAPEITAMILEHHKLSRHRGEPDSLVEPFRRADWVDVTRGLVRFGISRRFVTALYEQWPGAGFHRRLVGLELTQLRTRPWNPLPMLKW
jgi:hypothetical protein